MEDMLLREIEKTGKVLEAILLKLGVTTREKGKRPTIPHVPVCGRDSAWISMPYSAATT